jgi:hypothetical protein
MNKNTIAIFLILIGISAGILKNFQTNTIIDNDEVAILNIEKPSDDIISLVTPVSRLVTDPTDRAKLAIFNQEFSNRIVKYETDNQKVNDVYILAAKKFFKESIKDKYENLDTSLIDLFVGVVSNENHLLSQEEKEKVSKIFSGLAWSLIQK